MRRPEPLREFARHRGVTPERGQVLAHLAGQRAADFVELDRAVAVANDRAGHVPILGGVLQQREAECERLGRPSLAARRGGGAGPTQFAGQRFGTAAQQILLAGVVRVEGRTGDIGLER